MKRCFVAFVLVLMSVAMQAQSFPSWLAGKWEIPPAFAAAGSSYEEWYKVSSTQLEGKTYRMFGNDTIIFDRMQIKIENGNVVLKMSAEKQGKRFVGDFVGKMLREDVWMFECAEADSPSAIYYRKFEDGAVSVWTEVTTEREVCTEFTMYKIK